MANLHEKLEYTGTYDEASTLQRVRKGEGYPRVLIVKAPIQTKTQKFVVVSQTDGAIKRTIAAAKKLFTLKRPHLAVVADNTVDTSPTNSIHTPERVPEKIKFSRKMIRTKVGGHVLLSRKPIGKHRRKR